MTSKLKLSIENGFVSRYPLPVKSGECLIADDAVLNILATIQASIADLNQKVAALDDKVERQYTALDQRIAALDDKADRQFAVLSQDIRLIRGAMHDVAKTRVTTGEVDALHEDVNRVMAGMENLTMRVDILETRKD